MTLMPSVRTPDPNPGWLSEFALDETRSRVPILYVEAVPVRVDEAVQLRGHRPLDAPLHPHRKQGSRYAGGLGRHVLDGRT